MLFRSLRAPVLRPRIGLALLFGAETVEYESEHGLGPVSRSGCGAP